MNKKIFLMLIVLSFSLTLSSSVWANIMVEEGKIKKTIHAGETITGVLNIHNTADQSIKVKAYLEEFDYVLPYDGQKNFVPAGTTPTSFHNWFSFSPQEFTLPGFGKQEISYVLHAPEDIKGGYYGVIFFEKDFGKEKDATGVRLVTRVGCLFFFESENKLKKSDISNISIEGGQLKGDFTNQSDVILIPFTTYFIMDPEGLIVDRGEVARLYVPSGVSAPYTLSFDKNLAAGRYSMVLNMDLEDSDVFVKEIEFEKISESEYKIIDIKD